MERERSCTQNGDRIIKIQELVYNRPNLIRSQVGSIATLGCMLQFCIFFFFPQLICVFSSVQALGVKRQLTYSVQAKSKTEQCPCAFKYHSSARKRERECCYYVCVQFSVGQCQCIHICVHVYVLVCVCSLL